MLPTKTREDILDAIRNFDENLRNTAEWEDWEKRDIQKYALEYEGKLYPPKKIVSIATGKPVGEFGGGYTTNTYLKRLGFQVMSLDDDNLHVFLAPASNETSQSHMQDSLNPGKKFSEIHKHLSDKGKEKLREYVNVPTWGCVPSLRGRWQKMEPGDWVLFYVRGVFIYVGLVSHKEENRTLSREIWGQNSQGNSWDLMFFFEKLYKIDIGIESIRNLSNYSEKWILQGFMQMKDSAVQKAIEENGSFEAFLGLEDKRPMPPKEKTIEKIDATGEMKMEGFFKYLTEKGFLFDSKLVENYLLSLKIKPFVILTGNSGTGKTKIAQLFAKYTLNSEETSHNRKTIDTVVTVGKSPKYKGWNFPKHSYFDAFPSLKRYEKEVEIDVNGVKGTGRIYLAPSLYYDSRNQDIQHSLEEKARVNPHQKVSLKMYIPAEEKSGGDLYEVVPVGANWTETRHITGFYNVLTEDYRRTRALDLMLRAQGVPEKPHFLILDEMNLSHVERYFSDFLSMIESGEKVELHSDNRLESVPKRFEMPENLFVVGTVNVDETTYMFSPKVLDRANTIEFATHSPLAYMGENIKNTGGTGNIEYLENPLSDIDVRSYRISELREKFFNVKVAEGADFWDSLTHEIDRFQIEMKTAGFDFGFRVVDEIVRFMYVSWKYEGSQKTWITWERYLDAQLKQKILPKFHGSKRTLGDVLNRIQKMCFKGEVIVYPSTHEKITEMIDVLEKHKYVSFTR